MRVESAALLAVFALLTAAVPVAAQGAAVRLNDQQLRQIGTTGGLQRVTSAGTSTVGPAAEVLLWPGQLVVGVDTASVPARSVADTSRLVLPIRGYHIMAGSVHDFQVIVERHAGLQYDPGQAAYTGEIFVGLEDIQHASEQNRLSVPLELQLFGPDGIDPGLVAVDHTDIPLERVSLLSRTPAESVQVRVRMRGQPAVAFGVPVSRFPLELRPSAEVVDGYGLGTVTLTVSFPAGFTGDSVPVTIAGGRVTPEPNQVMLARGAPVSVRVRSTGSGTETFTAMGPHFTAPATASVEFGLPIGFVLAALLGGALGAWGRELMRQRREGGESGGGAIGRNVVTGLIGGLFVAVAYAVGVNVLDIDVTGPPVEAVIFLLSGVGAFAGIEVLSRLVPPLDRALRGG